jgi:hypothetical protein
MTAMKFCVASGKNRDCPQGQWLDRPGSVVEDHTVFGIEIKAAETPIPIFLFWHERFPDLDAHRRG